MYRDNDKMLVLKICAILLAWCAVLAVGEGPSGYTGREVRRDLPTGPPTPAPAHFCPYGGAYDEEMPPNDDDYSGPFPIPMRFPYFGRKYTCLYVSIITFTHPSRITFCLHQIALEDGCCDVDGIVDLSRCND